MGFDANRADLCIGVIGTGAMGRGIVQVAAAGGMHVLMMDTRAGAADEARDFVAKMLSRAAEKGSMTPADADAATARIKVAHSLAEFKACHMVVEAIVENLDAKRALFGELEDLVSADCILATNTSSMSVTTIAAKLKTPQRFAGFHCFNPVPLMKGTKGTKGGRFTGLKQVLALDDGRPLVVVVVVPALQRRQLARQQPQRVRQGVGGQAGVGRREPLPQGALARREQHKERRYRF